MNRFLVRSVAAVGAATMVCLAATAGAEGDLRVVARGLDSPRGSSVGPDGALYVSGAGRGGSGPTITGFGGEQVSYGPSGVVYRVDPRSGRTRRFIRGLPSLASRAGEAIGPSDVSFTRGGLGYLTVGLGTDPDARRQLPPNGRFMAYLNTFNRNGQVRHLVNLGDFEAANNSDDGQPTAEVDTNPNSVDTSRGRVRVADAGGNDLLAIRGTRASLITTFPFGTTPVPPGLRVPPGTTELPYQPVPTSVVRGPDGALYVGQLTGFPFPEGAANVYRIGPSGRPTVFASGFTQITDIAFDPRGRLYVLEIATRSLVGPPSPGALIRVSRDGRNRRELEPGSLRQPAGLTIAGGFAWVSDNSVDPGHGRVVRISLTR